MKNIETPNLDFSISPDAALKNTEESIRLAESKLTALTQIEKSNFTFSSTIKAFEKILNELDDSVTVTLFLKETSTSTKFQEIAAQCTDLITAFYAKLFTRSDLYLIFNSIETKPNQSLDLEDKKLLEETIRSFRRSGAHLDETTRISVSKLRTELSNIENKFATTLSKAGDKIEFTHSELEGMSQEFIDSLPKSNDGLYQLTLLDASTYIPFLDNAKNADARKKLIEAHDKVAPENIILLEEALSLRKNIAQLLGFKNHACFVLDGKMAKTPEKVEAFLSDLRIKLKPKLKADLEALLELKRNDEPSSTHINLWDWRYYANQLVKRRYQVDNELIREYFPLEHVTQSVFSIYENLLQIKFIEVKPAKAWCDEVKLYAVTDESTSKVVGYFYFDIFPREGKFKHFAAFTISQGRELDNGSYKIPVSAIVGNFSKPTQSSPSLLRHGEVETFFHELGHIMHQILTKARYSSFAGTSVRGDFVEVPSQMLENWCWDKKMLLRISKHHKTGKPLPADLIEKIINAQHANEGLFWSRQLFFAMIDFKFHTENPPVDTTALWHKLQPELFTMESIPNTRPQGTFGHLMGGYDCGYYGYLWSKVFAEDLFTEFEKHGLENPEVGLRYRKHILESGGREEPDILMNRFLKREPNSDAFIRSLGL